MQPKTTKTEELEAAFNELADEWENNRPRGVDLHEMVKHPAYRQIIDIGEEAVPLLLRRLEQKPGHWFWALQRITGAAPVPEDSYGNLEKMAAAWLRWGQEQGYRW